MEEKSYLLLRTESISNVPLQKFENSFTFHVNDNEYRTGLITALILSPKLCQFFYTDPTIDEITINTKNPGDFSHILDLINFDYNYISESEIPFIQEVVEFLGNKSIEVHDKTIETTLTLENVFDLLKTHENNSIAYSNSIQKEIEFIASNFFNIDEDQEEELMSLKMKTLEDILENPKIQLESEDQLISFINKLYLRDSNFSHFYEYVNFLNVTSKKMNDFIKIYDINDINNKIWEKISDRLHQPMFKSTENLNKTVTRYLKHDFFYENQDFNGIINYFRFKTNGKIENEVLITSSSNYGTDLPVNVSLFDDINKVFQSGDQPNAWICFDFKEKRVIPFNYSIRSYYHYSKNAHHPKTWVIEASNDNETWVKIDEQKNCQSLNGRYLSETFKIENEDHREFRYIRMRQTGLSWGGSNYLTLDSFELYGTLI